MGFITDWLKKLNEANAQRVTQEQEQTSYNDVFTGDSKPITQTNNTSKEVAKNDVFTPETSAKTTSSTTNNNKAYNNVFNGESNPIDQTVNTKPLIDEKKKSYINSYAKAQMESGAYDNLSVEDRHYKMLRDRSKAESDYILDNMKANANTFEKQRELANILSGYEDAKNESDDKAYEYEQTYIAHTDDSVLERGLYASTNALVSVGANALDVYDITKDYLGDKLGIKHKEYNDPSNLSTEVRDIRNKLNTFAYSGLDQAGNMALQAYQSGLENIINFAFFSGVGAELGMASNVTQAITTGAMSIPSFTQKYEQNLNEGYDDDTAMLNAALTGVVSYAIEALDVGRMTDIVTGKLKGMALGAVARNMLVAWRDSAVGEAFEEFVEWSIDPIIDSLTLGKPIEYDTCDLWTAMGVAALSGWSGSAQSIVFSINTKPMANKINADIQECQKLINSGILTNQEINESKQYISAAQNALSLFNEKAILSNAVELETDENYTVRSVNELYDDYEKSQKPFDDALIKLREDANVVLQDINGINEDAIEYSNLSQEARENVNNITEYASKQNLDVAFSKNLDIETDNGTVTANGYVDRNTGVVVLNPDSTDGVRKTLGHELMHLIKSRGENDYNTLIEQLGKPSEAELNEYKQRYSGVDADITEEYYCDKIAEKLDDSNFISKMVDEGLISKLQNFRDSLASKLGQKSATLVKTFNEALENSLPREDIFYSNGMAYSIRSMTSDLNEGTMIQDLVQKGILTEEQAKNLETNLRDLVEFMSDKEFRKYLDLNETEGKNERKFSPIKPNSDPLYKLSLDFSTLCQKRILTQHIIEQLQLQLKDGNGKDGRPLTREETLVVREMLSLYKQIDNSIMVQCGMCYVEAARLKSPKQVERWLANPESFIRGYYAKHNNDFKAQVDNVVEEYINKYNQENGTNITTKKGLPTSKRNELTRIQQKMYQNYEFTAEEAKVVEQAKNIDNSVYLTASNLAQLMDDNPELYKIYIETIRNSTKSKGLEQDIAYYYGDSNIASDEFINAVNKENGMRAQSWSDFQMQHMLDYVSAVIDMSVRRAKMHTYTKFPQMVRIFGDTGIMFNMSGVPSNIGLTGPLPSKNVLSIEESLALLDFSKTDSVDIKEALELREKYPNTVGLQCIGMSEEHTRALLRSVMIDYVIPYHASGLNKGSRVMIGIDQWNDSTKSQHAKIIDANAKAPAGMEDVWHVEPTFSEFFVGNEKGSENFTGLEIMKMSADKYVELCEERGLTPKFSEYLDEENYWKLLIDRKMINQQTGEIIVQEAVKPNFNFDSIKDEVKLAYQELKTSPEKETKLAKAIADVFLDSNSKNGVSQDARDLQTQMNKPFKERIKSEKYNTITTRIKNVMLNEVNTANVAYSLPSVEEYFKDSKARDEDGNLQVVYHGSPTKNITTFDPTKAGSNVQADNVGIYFTDSKNLADDFSYQREKTNSMFIDSKGQKGQVYETYLNMTKPLDFANLTKEEIANLYDYASNLGKLDGKDKFVENMTNWQEIGNHQLMKANLDLNAISKDYDGVIANIDNNGNEHEYIVFNSNQIKDVNNTNPTSNPDIRYSLPSDSEKTKHYSDALEGLEYEYFKRSGVEDLELTEEEFNKFINKDLQDKKTLDRIKTQEDALIKTAKDWIPNYYEISEEFPQFQEQNLSRALFEILTYGDLKEETKNELVNDFIEEIGYLSPETAESTYKNADGLVKRFVKGTLTYFSAEAQYQLSGKNLKMAANRAYKIYNDALSTPNADMGIEASMELAQQVLDNEKLKEANDEYRQHNMVQVADALSNANNKNNPMNDIWKMSKVWFKGNSYGQNVFNDTVFTQFFNAQSKFMEYADEGKNIVREIEAMGIKEYKNHDKTLKKLSKDYYTEVSDYQMVSNEIKEKFNELTKEVKETASLLDKAKSEEDAKKIKADNGKYIANLEKNLKELNEVAADKLIRLSKASHSEEFLSDFVHLYGQGKLSLGQLSTLDYKTQNGLTAYENILKATELMKQYNEKMYKIFNDNSFDAYGDVEVTSMYETAQLANDYKQAQQIYNQAKEAHKINPNKETVAMLKKAENTLKLKEKLYNAKLYDMATNNDTRRQKVPYRKNYMHQAHKQGTFLAQLRNAYESEAQVSTNLAGLSEYVKPKSMFSTLSLEQGSSMLGENTDAMYNFKDFVNLASKKAAFDPYLVNMRALEGLLRDTNVGQTKANQIVNYLTEYNNMLAGKSNSLDRFIRDKLGSNASQTLEVVSVINNRVKKNQVYGNLRSAIVQIGALPNGISTLFANGVSEKDIVKGAINAFKNDSSYLSPFMYARNFEGDLKSYDDNLIGNAEKATDYIMSLGQSTADKIVWNSAYTYALEQKKTNPELDPVRYADELTRNAMAGRSLGELPTMMRGKTIGMIIPFQTEVNNDFNSFMQFASDLKQGIETKDKELTSRNFKAISSGLVACWLMNNLFESLFADRPLPDFLEAILGAFDDDEDDDYNLITRLIGEALSNTPFGNKIASEIVGLDSDEAKKLFGDNDPTRYGSGISGVETIKDILGAWEGVTTGDAKKIDDSLLNVLTSLGTNGYGNQIKKTYQGAKTLGLAAQEGVIEQLQKLANGEDPTTHLPVSYTDSGRIRYVNDTLNIPNDIKTIAFGPWASEYAQEYIDSGFKALGTKQTQNLESLTEDMSAKDAEQVAKDISKATNKTDFMEVINDDSISYKNKNDIYDEQFKNVKYTGYVNDIDEKYDLSEEEEFALKYITTFSSIKDESGNTISGSKAMQVREYLTNEGLYDEVLDYLNESGLQPKDLMLTKGVVAMDDDEFAKAYAQLMGETSPNSNESVTASKYTPKSKTTQNKAKTSSSSKSSAKATKLSTDTGLDSLSDSELMSLLKKYFSSAKTKNTSAKEYLKKILKG